MKIIGYFVVDHCEDFEQPLAIRTSDKLPPGGVLDWGAPVHLFPNRKSAKEAIARTDHYAKAFGKNDLPDKKFCKIIPVEGVK